MTFHIRPYFPTVISLFILTALSASIVFADTSRTPVNDRMTWPEGTPRSDAAVDLGRHLFFDPRLVLSEDQSCASCHSPHAAFADSVARDLTAHKDWGRAKRNSPTIYNLTDAPVVHWDGRTPAGQCFTPEDTNTEVCLEPLESQAFKSMRSRKIYDGFLPKVKAEPAYQDMFKQAFPPNGEVTHLNMALAIAAFERSLVSNDSAYDRYIAGDPTALSVEARRGFEIYEGKGNCAACHNGPNLTDWQFHNIGVDSDDEGRSAKIEDEDKKAEFRGAFKTPGLRNVALTAPYMHDGSIGTLEKVVEFYDRGGDRHDNLSPLIEPLNLTDREKWDLIAFLNALTHTVGIEPPSIPGIAEIH
ncbi:cytochrome c peroxidase [uncultured Roseovarius sp.]|uniref:cytochrome c peroxidase n=1 Tax=uncultured Roseovarius sp. TaxID=293344 RepID=UPI0026211F2D|nr:cytochrome c peroxidase [uncultured Roseovarius sp.]